MKKAIYPGSFDPLTNGHMDIIERAAKMTDKLIVAILRNTSKKSWFSEGERIMMLEQATIHLPNVEVDVFGGLLVDYARGKGARHIVRGLRMMSDFESEMGMAAMNKHMAAEIDTLFLMTGQEWAHLSSSLVKEVAIMGGEIDGMIPAPVKEIVKRRLSMTDEGDGIG